MVWYFLSFLEPHWKQLPQYSSNNLLLCFTENNPTNILTNINGQLSTCFPSNKCKNIQYGPCDCYQAWVSANTPHHPHYNHFYSIPSLFLAFPVCVIGRFYVLRREVGIQSPWGLLSKLLNAYRWSHQMTLWLFCIVFWCIQMNVFHSKTLKTHILLSEAGCDYVSYQALLKFPPWDQAKAIVSY